MHRVFVDDSLRSNAGFLLCAIVVAPVGIDAAIAQALATAGITPGSGEFKSGDRMHGRSELVELKHSLAYLLSSSCKVGVVVSPASEHARQGPVVVDGIAHIVKENELGDQLSDAFLDQGMFRTVRSANECWAVKSELGRIRLHAEQDSKKILGIQLADAAAHTCGSMLQDLLAPTGKTVKAGDNSGYDPDEDLELGFALWGSLRYSFFRRASSEPNRDTALLDSSSGLYIAPSCSDQLREAAIGRFASVWMGCIH